MGEHGDDVLRLAVLQDPDTQPAVSGRCDDARDHDRGVAQVDVDHGIRRPRRPLLGGRPDQGQRRAPRADEGSVAPGLRVVAADDSVESASRLGQPERRRDDGRVTQRLQQPADVPRAGPRGRQPEEAEALPWPVPTTGTEEVGVRPRAVTTHLQQQIGERVPVLVTDDC